MTYREAIDFLYRLRVFGMKLGLENTRRLATVAGNPERRLRFIHVAGTNGKGSTCAMLESICRCAGLRAGLFTSPHLVSFGERIQVNRQPIGPEDIVRLTERMRGLIHASEVEPTFFEAATIMALAYFAEQECDIVIWETGLGGRLDATNIVTPLASVITNIQLDHQRWLGDTTAAIAREKAGIIKPGVPVLTATADADALEVIRQTAAKLNAPLTVVGAKEAAATRQYNLALAGEHQQYNAALAVAAVRALAAQLPVTEAAVARGLSQTNWAARLQKVARPGGGVILIDCAHNPAGARSLAQALQADFSGCRPAFILAMMADKDYEATCQVLAPLAEKIFLSPIQSDRAARPEALAESCRKANPNVNVTVCQTLAEALKLSMAEPFVVLTGSIHFVGEAMEALGLQTGPALERGLNEYTAAPRAVTFDVGGTLIEPWPSVGHVYAEVAARHGIKVSPDELNRHFNALWRARKNFGYRLSDWSELVDATFNKPPGEAFFSDVYACFATAAPWRVFPDVVPYLESLRRQGLKLGIISNWDERLRPLLRALSLEHYFDVVVVSGEVGSHKPDPRIFKLAAGQLGLSPSAILHVGDSAAEDIEGARAAGFQARLLRRSEGEVLKP